jgi:endonuclease-3
MARATSDAILPYIRSVSYPNNKAKHLAGMARMLMDDFQGEVPSDREELVRLPGVGRKTANVIASVVYNQPAMAVDTHVYRVSHRIGLVDTKANTPLKVELGLITYIPEALVAKAHHWLILHGRYICIARRPLCEKCPLTPACRYFEKNIKNAQPSAAESLL